MDKYKNGFLYVWICNICKGIYKINLVEYFKKFAVWMCSFKVVKVQNSEEREIKIKSLAIDIYKLIKLVFLLSIWIFNVRSNFVTVIVIYLIITTLMTYLKYHFWNKNRNNDFERNRRRFLSMILSFGFIVLAYGYLYDIPFENTIVKQSIVLVEEDEKEDLNGCEVINWDEALLYSISNSFGGNYSNIVAVNKLGDWLSLSQVIITFSYLTFIFSKSVFGEGN